jgi:hypothetical protein
VASSASWLLAAEAVICTGAAASVGVTVSAAMGCWLKLAVK